MGNASGFINCALLFPFWRIVNLPERRADYQQIENQFTLAYFFDTMHLCAPLLATSGGDFWFMVHG